MLVVAIVAISIAAVVLSQVKALRNFEWQFDPGWLVLGIAAFLIMPGIHAELWRRILATMGYPLPLSRGWSIWSLSLLARYVPTQLLMPITRIAMCDKEDVPKRVTLATIVYEFALVASASVAVGALFFVEWHKLDHVPERWLVIVVPLLALIALHPRVFGPVSSYALRKAKREPLQVLLSESHVLTMFVGYVISFLVAGIGTVGCLRAVHPLPTSDVPIVMTAWAVGYGGALIAFFVPGGLGVRDGATASVLATTVPLTVGVAVAVLIRLLQTAIELLYAGVASFAARRSAAAAAPEAVP
jgi:glycosyltransferase 2 family protein